MSSLRALNHLSFKTLIRLASFFKVLKYSLLLPLFLISSVRRMCDDWGDIWRKNVFLGQTISCIISKDWNAIRSHMWWSNLTLYPQYFVYPHFHLKCYQWLWFLFITQVVIFHWIKFDLHHKGVANKETIPWVLSQFLIVEN